MTTQGVKTFNINGQVNVKFVHNECFLQSIDGGTIFHLNESATIIFSLISKGITNSQVLDEMVNMFGGEKSHYEFDVEELLKHLQLNGIMTIRDGVSVNVKECSQFIE